MAVLKLKYIIHRKDYMKEDISTTLTGQIIDVLETEKELAVVENELQMNPQFKKFLQLQKSVNEQSTKVWKQVETAMIENDIKQLKGDFGTVTLAERLNWTTSDELPSKFYKKVVDTKRLSDTYRLEGKAPKGATPSYTKYLTKRLKEL
jgi:hypothetical protein